MDLVMVMFDVWIRLEMNDDVWLLLGGSSQLVSS